MKRPVGRCRHPYPCQPPSGGCVLKHRHSGVDIILITPAAFGRLCVETAMTSSRLGIKCPAAFGRLCVETTYPEESDHTMLDQPPSGGCVLKLLLIRPIYSLQIPAAFGRLCVETPTIDKDGVLNHPAAFGRLCVETACVKSDNGCNCPAAFGRLCVETPMPVIVFSLLRPAAFGRLCVETVSVPVRIADQGSSRLRAAVC